MNVTANIIGSYSDVGPLTTVNDIESEGQEYLPDVEDSYFLSHSDDPETFRVHSCMRCLDLDGCRDHNTIEGELCIQHRRKCDYEGLCLRWWRALGRQRACHCSAEVRTISGV